ncbi:uncharacterized protein LOC112468739 [Temnothorax curvispinosus]|uniref:Uncharacterized protein LOC112468739 n=1 Tax=Temnothorax curvispinosus TaxID=300111 RepID=A0A6J1RFU4_9HYME|nr:uncharacterized protein LOC112468739 [Temnothorax curvispinosus]
MLVRAPYSFLFILAVCSWFRYNAAVPLASHSSNQMQDAFKEKKTDSQSDSDDNSLNSGSMRETKTLEDTSEDDEHDEHEETDEDDENDEISNTSNVNQNMNMNMNTNVFNRGERHRITRNGERHKQTTTTEDTTTVTEYGTLEEMAREEATNCGNARRMNQRYSSSFYENTTDNALTVEKEFHDMVGNNSKVKKSGSVHEGEDITLCWIEMTTIKEDKTTQPPKRLVIREYTISFENSVTIPERYLECKRYEGELTANDPDIGKTALFEVIDEDTMVSRVVNFTSVNHAGNVTTWQHKKVKCGVGPVVSKNIVELNDGSKNPKKRVEIKVSPKMHQLTATTTEEEPCTESSEETEESSTLTESTEHATGLSCENGVCETTVTSPSISTKNGKVSTAEETVTKLQSKTESESEEDYSLPPVTKSLTLPDEEVSRRSTTFPKISTTIQEYQEKIDCEENSSDPACLTEKYSKYDTPSPGQLFPELSAEVSTTEAETSIPIGRDKEITAKEEGRLKETTQSSFTSREEKKVTSDLVTEETIVTDISMESTEAHASQSTDQVSVDDSSTISLETKIMTSEEVDKIDHVPSSSKVTSKVTSGKVETEPDITTAIPVEFIEFTKGPDKPGQGLDKLSESPISTESVTGPIIIESSSTSEEVPSEESEESKTSAIEGTALVGGPKTSSEGKFVSMSTRTLPKEVRSTTLSPAISSEVDHSCENSEECEHIASSEACDASGNCGETTTRCDSGECSKEGITEDQSKFDTSPPLIMTKVPPSATSSRSSEESGMIETQHTTVANVATTMLTSRENTSTVVNIPVTMDTRRSTTTSTPRHKLTLKVKVLLEHINENKEKQNLVEVEKHLSLDENPGQHDNPELLEQLKSLNDSVNMETISALLNCTSLGNLTRDSNFVSGEPGDAVDGNDEELEFSDIDPDEDSISEPFASGYVDAKSDYSEYEEHEVSSRRRRRRRSLVNPMKELNRFVRRSLYDPTDSVVDSFNTSLNVSKSQQTELTKDNLQLSTTTNYTEEETTENERNTTKEKDESTTTLFSTTMSIIDLSNASESHEANQTKENIQLTTTIKPEEETSNAVYIGSEKNITNERNESARSLTKENISNETKMEVVRETLPGIQQDVVVGLQHMVSQLAQGNLTSIKNIPEAVKTNLLGILADPKDTRVHSRRRRAAAEEVGHWSNERIKEAPMGGNLRSLTEFTLYKVVP